jgi:hypothetical protein
MSNLVTAADIERELEYRPDLNGTPIGRLFSLGWNIEARLEKVDQYGAKAADMAISARQLIDEAKKLCDSEGFAAFKLRHCPSLAKSRTYELLAIESGTKTVEEIRAATRDRVAKHRAEKKARVTEKDSVTSPILKVVTVNGQPMDMDRLGPAAQEQIAAAVEPAEPDDGKTPEELRAELAKAKVAIELMGDEIAHIDDPDTTFDSAWHEAATEIERLDADNKELRAEVERLKGAQATPAVSYLDKPWLAHAADEARQPEPFNPDAPLVDLEKKLQGIVAQMDAAEKAAATLILHMVEQRKQSVRSIAKLIGKDPKWVKKKFNLAKPVTEAAA